MRGIDLRDLYRPGSGLTLRRVLVLTRALPRNATVWLAEAAAHEKAKLPTVEQLRKRQAHYRGLGN